ncbi:MAG: diphthamide biosynthesis enzyme Dph2 [Methanocorpusculum sp.]|nr:diphthamide biosynthesis enzyme Dph2 [Methanocorpusculum sp.]
MNPINDILEAVKTRSNIKKVAVQLPEGLKHYAPEISAELKKAGYGCIISGDACWGACDLALDALEDADILVHVGHIPVTQHKNVIYIPYLQDISLENLNAAVSVLSKYNSVGIVTTIQHAHQSQQMAEYLKTKGINAVVGKGSGRTPVDGQVLGCTYETAEKAKADAYLFVGTGVFHAIGVALAAKKPTFALDPFGNGGVLEVSGDKLLRRRFVQIEKAKNAKNFGILLSSKSGQCRKELAKRLVSLSEKTSLVLIREVSEMELRNLGFDAYVNTACPRLAVDDQSRFSVPVLSPAEFEIVLGLRDWEDYEIDEIKTT